MLIKCTINDITKLDFEIYIDETKIVDIQHISNKVYINCPISNGVHHLRIVRNKENNISKSHIKKYNIIHVNKVFYHLKFDINKDSFLELTYVSKKIELEKNHIHWQVFKCDRNNVKIIEESSNFDELCNIIKKYGTKILLKDMGFVTAFVFIGISIILTILHEFSRYGMLVLIYFFVVFSGFGIYYLTKWLKKWHQYHTLIKKISANEIYGSVDLSDWFIYDGGRPLLK